MYLIVSGTANYKGKIRYTGDIIEANTIGHEIHVTRPIIMILLSKNLISPSDIIVTKNKERYFLYSNIFPTVISYEDMPSNLDDSQVVDLAQASMVFHGYGGIMHTTDLEKRFPIMSDIRTNKRITIRTEEYNTLMTNIHYTDCSDIIKKDFVVIHYRLVDYDTNKINYVNEIISATHTLDSNLQIIVFCANKQTGYADDITFVDDISIYASLMHDDRCKAVITEFSGGGQLTQYCHSKKIFYFCKAYPVYTGHDLQDVINEANHPNHLYDRFDLKLHTDASIYVFPNLASMIANLKTYYLDTGKKYLRI